MAAISFFKDSAGKWRWVGSYTNSLIDDDLPRDIITSDAHRKAVDEIDAGAWAMPPLYIWHEKAWKIGETDFVALDEAGEGIVFVLASGPVDEDKAQVAEILASVPCTMSHGIMVYKMQDLGAHREIVEYRTTEVSVLPQGIASPANPYTYFTTLSEDSMVSEQKRSRLLSLLPESLVNAIEGGNKALADDAVKEGIMHKDTEELVEAVAAEAAAETETPAEAEAPAETETPAEAEAAEPVEVDTLSLDDAQVLGEVVGRAIAALRADIAKALSDSAAQSAQLGERVAALEAKATEEKAAPDHWTAGGALDRFLVGMVKASAETEPDKEEKAKTPAEAPAHPSGTLNIFEKVIGGK